MSEDDYEETQWTDKAKQDYQERADGLIDALRAHVSANLTRAGRQKELGPYFESADDLMKATRAFNEAEFDWCGSFPLGLRPDEDDEDEDELEEQPEAVGDVLTLLGRWDFRVTDEAAAVAAGRRAYLAAWTDDTEEDAESRVQHVDDAAAELMHAHGLAGLENAEGLSLERDATAFMIHEGEDDETFDDDPFAITRD